MQFDAGPGGAKGAGPVPGLLCPPHHSSIKSSFSGRRYALALAGIRRRVVQIRAVKKRGFDRTLRAGGAGAGECGAELMSEISYG